MAALGLRRRRAFPRPTRGAHFNPNLSGARIRTAQFGGIGGIGEAGEMNHSNGCGNPSVDFRSGALVFFLGPEKTRAVFLGAIERSVRVAAHSP